jgi:hypothetical protein
MKKWNHLMLIVAVATVGVSLPAQASNPSASGRLTDNAALLSSPRYLEDHPELLRGWPNGRDISVVKAQQFPALTDNIALAGSPRYEEKHPELLRSLSPAEQHQADSEATRMRKLTENSALAATPRFREVHPELLRAQPVFEIAPVK